MFKATFRIKIDLPKKKFFLSFLDFEQHLFELLTRNFCPLFSQLQLRDHSNVFIKNIFFKKVFFANLLPFLGGFFSCLVRKSTTDLTKVHFLSPKDISWKKKFEKKIKLTYYLPILSKLLLRFGMKLQQSYQISHFVLEDFFEQKHLFWKKD